MTFPPLDRRALPPGLAFRTIAGGDGGLRAYDWPSVTTASRGSILFQTGRADFIEKYLEALGWWHDQGWSVSGFDWRGQGGSARGTCGGASLDAMLDDLAEEVGAWIARTTPPHVLMGHSMGGHLLLRLLAERQADVAAAVFVAPMLGLAHAPLPIWAARGLANAACAIGLGERPFKPGDAGARQRRLTACAERYADEGWWRQSNPDLTVNPLNWAWLSQAMASIAKLDAPKVMERVKVPVLIVASPRDRLVSAAAIRAAAKRLPDARLVMLNGAHELLREADPIRSAAFAAIDAFLDEKAVAA